MIALGVLAVGLAAGYMLWLRDSSLVAVEDVKVVGVSSAERAEVGAALVEAGREMTTLHVREDRLRAAAGRFPTVSSVKADPEFPNGLTIEVTEREAVAVLAVDGRDLPVAGDGTLLPGIATAGLDLPTVDARAERSQRRLSGVAFEQARVLGAAPEPLRPLIEEATEDEAGIGVRLIDGIEVVFANASRADEKWAVASRILADDRLDGLAYIDVRAPDRPAVGGASSGAEAG